MASFIKDLLLYPTKADRLRDRLELIIEAETSISNAAVRKSLVDDLLTKIYKPFVASIRKFAKTDKTAPTPNTVNASRYVNVAVRYNNQSALTNNEDMMQYRLDGYGGYAVKFSPYFNDQLAVAGAKNFGLVGNGALFTFRMTPNGLVQDRKYDTQDALYDVAYSESNENQILAGCGNGTVYLFDTTIPDHPVASWNEHTKEVYATSWNLRNKDTFATSSWDGTVKIFNPNRAYSQMTLYTHSCTYSAAFAPHHDAIVSSVSSDSIARVFDLRKPNGPEGQEVIRFAIHGQIPGVSHIPAMNCPPSEALTHDWNKYKDTVLAIGGVDTFIRVFDIRYPGSPLSVMEGHQYAVRRVAYSPHLSDGLLSASYDMTVRSWADGSLDAELGVASVGECARGHVIHQYNGHTEFVTGVDWCMFGDMGWVASTAWDQLVKVYDISKHPAPRNMMA